MQRSDRSVPAVAPAATHPAKSGVRRLPPGAIAGNSRQPQAPGHARRGTNPTRDCGSQPCHDKPLRISWPAAPLRA